MIHGTPPWHMWGNSAGVTLPVPGSTTGVSQGNGQLAHIQYKRPETWTFFFGCRVTGFDYAGGAVPSLDVFFDLTLGVGRAVTNIEAFETYHWNLPAEQGIFRYSTEVVGPLRSASDTQPNLITNIPAQQINCTWRANLFVPAGAPATLSLELQAYFAPRSHIRPEWFEPGGAKYNGGEDKGR